MPQSVSPRTLNEPTVATSITDDGTLCVVTRAFQGDHRYEPGEAFRIEPSRRREVLIRDRRIRDIERSDAIYQCACGRLWLGEKQAQNHCS